MRAVQTMLPAGRRATLAMILVAAQTVLALPGSAEQRVRAPYVTSPAEQQLERLAENRQQAGRGFATPTARTAATSDDTRPLFRLGHVTVDGATVIAHDRIAASYADLVGRDVSQAELLEITGRITAIYREAGYHLSRAVIPPQALSGGRLRIQVIEGMIEDVEVKGDADNSFGLRQILVPVTLERPSRLATMEARLLLVNDRPGVRISDTALSEIVPGSGRFKLVVTARVWRGFVVGGVDNLGSRATGPWQGSAGAALNSVLVPGDSLSVAGSTTPGSSRELRFGRLTYDMPVGSDWVRLGASASKSDVWPGDIRRTMLTQTQSETYDARLSVTPVLTQTHALTVTGSFGISDIVERNAFGPTFKDSIWLATLSADYKLHATKDSWTYISAYFRKGLGLVDPRPDSDVWISRGDASPHFSVFAFSVNHYQNLVDNWSLKLSAAGQVASGALLTSQQFYLGGQTYGRGFESGWLAGDNALAGSAELRYERASGLPFAKSYQLYAFLDGGVLRSFEQPRHLVQSLVSAGAGVRLTFDNDTQIGLAIAKPVTYSSPGRGTHGATVLFSLTSALRFCPGQGGWSCNS